METRPSSCRHCGSPVPANRGDEFCCTGCAFVFQMLHEQGFDHFYDLRGSQAIAPVPAQAMREMDCSWLEPLASQNEIAVSIQGLSCIGCVWLVERVFSRRPGALAIRVDVVRGEAVMTAQPGVFDPVAFARELQSFGYLLGPKRLGEDREKQATGLERRLGVCGALAMNAMAFSLPAYFGMPRDFMFAGWFDLIAAASATLSMLVGGSYFIERSARSLRMGMLHIDTPISLGILAAFAGSLGGWLAGVEGLKYFDFVSMFIFLMLVGRWAQQAAVEKNRRKLMRDSSIPESVTVIAADGAAASKPVAELREGERFRVKPSQAVPVAARLADPAASISLEWINGESEAQHREAGQLLPAGALNISSREIEAGAVETWERSTLRRLLEARKPGEQRDLRLERLLRWYLGIVIAAGLGGAVWWWSHGHGLAAALQVMISVFVVSCPCALGVAAPFADDLAASRAAKLGVFVRTIGIWKKLGRIRKAVFDKTGTLTLENPVLKNPEALAVLDDIQRSALAKLVAGNLHPVSRSLFDALGIGLSQHASPAEVKETAGHGLEFADEQGIRWSLGKSADGSADAEFRQDGRLIAGFFFQDQLRSESVEEMRRLAARKAEAFILSGDREEKVAAIARQLGLPADRHRAAMNPEQKAAWVREHNADDLLYIGDGANDSLAFDASLCAGSPVTGRSFLEHKADFYFLGHSMGFVSSLLDVARQHRRAVRRVFAFSVAYNVITAAFSLAGHLNPLAAAILMPLSSVATLAMVGVTFGSGRARAGAKMRNEALPASASASCAAM